jgi:hypothetical protein
MTHAATNTVPATTAPAPAAVGGGWREPTRADLAAIDAEWPLLEAELAVVDAECQAVAWPGPITRRALRRALRRLAAVYALDTRGVAGA